MWLFQALPGVVSAAVWKLIPAEWQQTTIVQPFIYDIFVEISALTFTAPHCQHQHQEGQ